MRIGMISTYPPIECGIATYTQYLTEALRKQNSDVYIISHYGGKGEKVFPSFDYEDGDLSEKAFNAMVRFTPDVVHIQHEFGLFGKNFGVNVIPLIINFNLVGIPVVTTLHTVYREIPDSHKIILRNICLNSDKIIVHETYQKDILKNHFDFISDDKIHVIPHGARELDPIPNAREKLGLPAGKPILLMIGYFRPSKNFERIIEILPEIINHVPDALLVIAGKIRGKEHLEYRQFLFNKIESSPVKDHILLVRGQLPQETFDTILSAADVVVLPYKINSQSGILAHTLALGKPFVGSNTPAMKELVKKTHTGFIADTDEEFIHYISRILQDKKLQKKFSQNARNYVCEEISWHKIARQHMKLYQSIIAYPQIVSRVLWVD